jgi:hypothetical protein
VQLPNASSRELPNASPRGEDRIDADAPCNDYNVLLTDVNSDVLFGEISRVMGIKHLSPEMPRRDARVFEGRLWGTKLRWIVPLLVTYKAGNSRWIRFISAVLQTSRASRRASRSHEKGSFSTVLDTSQEDSTLLDNSRHAPLRR